MRLSLAGDRSTDSLFRALIHGMVLHTRTCCQGILPKLLDERREPWATAYPAATAATARTAAERLTRPTRRTRRAGLLSVARAAAVRRLLEVIDQAQAGGRSLEDDAVVEVLTGPLLGSTTVHV